MKEDSNRVEDTGMKRIVFIEVPDVNFKIKMGIFLEEKRG